MACMGWLRGAGPGSEGRRGRVLLLAFLVGLTGAPAVAADADPVSNAALGRQVDELKRAGRYAEATTVVTQVLAEREKRLGPDHLDVATALSFLGDLQQIQGHYAESERLLRRCLTIREAHLGPDDPAVARALSLLGWTVLQLGRHAEAATLAQRSLAIREAKLGANDPSVVSSLNVLATAIRGQGRLAEAEPLYRRALAILEARPGPEGIQLARILNNLAVLYALAGRPADAEAYYRRAMTVEEKLLGPDNTDLANTLNNLGWTLRQIGRTKEAEPLIQRALAIRERAFGPENPMVAKTMTNLAEIYRLQRRYGDAERLLERARAIQLKQLGPDHPVLMDTYTTLALIYEAQKHPQEAEAAFKRSIAIGEAAYGPTAFNVITARVNLAYLYDDEKRYDLALEQSRLATDAAERHRESEAEQRGTGIESEHVRYRWFFFQRVYLAHQLSEAAPEQRAALAAESFETAQLVHASKTGQAIAGMAARFAAGNDALAGVVRERQDLVERWQRLDGRIVEAASKPPAERDVAAEKIARFEQASLGDKLTALEARIAKEFPQYAELSSPRPVKLAELQAILGTDEAMLAYLSSADTTWLWAVRRDRVAFYEFRVKGAALAKEVGALRQRLDPALNPDLKPFDVKRAYALHQMILAPAAADIEGARHVFIVPDGALQSLPIGVLVTEPPPAKLDYRKTAWLARQYATTTLPSVSSLRALREFARRPHAPLPFLGIGDPALGGAAGETRGAHPVAFLRGALADVDEVRKLPPLPETADELRALAESQGAGADSLYLRDRASEAVLKTLKLDQYRVLAFATHGLVADELQDQSEPALVLSPPSKPTRENDGLLTASEIAQLKLNADWVILSACNTASGDGTPGADRLSGLAKAFFYAGSRALLVSHWPVASQAAVRLTTGALDALKREPTLGRAEALRRSQLALLDDTSVPFSHPMLWAPFVVVGEGGTER